MELIDLSAEFGELVRTSRTTIEFKARFWAWLDEQRRQGPLRLLLDDMERHWSSVGSAPTLSEARDLLRQFAPGGYAQRVAAIGERYRELVGVLPSVPVILLVGLGRPEGYSRFDRGQNTIFLGLDHPTAVAHSDHLEVILSHELCHAVRDPHPDVLGDYKGHADMGHDDFVARHPFREHLVSEALATSISEAAYGGRPERRYVYFDEESIRWCHAHRREIADRMLLALEREEPYRTFYAEGSVTPDSPDCCDYWFGLHLGRFALALAPPGELLRLPATTFLERYLMPFAAEFAGQAVAPARPPDPPTRREAALSEEEPLIAASLPPTVRHAYEEYEERLTRQPELARQFDEGLADRIAQAGLLHAGEPWNVHAFPLFLSAEDERHLRWATDGLLRLIEQVIDLYRSDREVRRFFDFPRHVEELCVLDPGYRPHVMLGRFDAYWSGRRTRFLELNCNGAAMWCLAELLGKEALDMPDLGPLLARHGAEGWVLTSHMYDALVQSWHQARGTDKPPRRMAIVDWPDVAAATEQRRLAGDFTKMGVPTDVVSPADLVYDGKELRGPGGPIDVVYRRLTTIDLFERSGELPALLEAARANAMVTVSSWASDVAHSKRLFAFLTHELWQRRLSSAQRSLIDAHVPWTRMFVPGRTQYEGRRHDLRELALAARDRFVLKPTEGYEGRGVLLGIETPPAQWAAEVERRFGGAYVLQEAVRAPLRHLLRPRGHGVERVKRWLHLGEFVIAGKLAGVLARTSEELVLNAQTRERAIPSFVLSDDDGAGADQDFGPAAP